LLVATGGVAFEWNGLSEDPWSASAFGGGISGTEEETDDSNGASGAEAGFAKAAEQEAPEDPRAGATGAPGRSSPCAFFHGVDVPHCSQ
jgi:hypothetical protein